MVGVCWIEEQVNCRGIQDFFFAQGNEKRKKFYHTTQQPNHTTNTPPDVEKHARPAREVRLSIRSALAALAPREDSRRPLSNTTKTRQDDGNKHSGGVSRTIG